MGGAAFDLLANLPAAKGGIKSRRTSDSAVTEMVTGGNTNKSPNPREEGRLG